VDNRVFNINGHGNELLEKVLELAFHGDFSTYKCESWQQTKEDGLILYRSSGERNYNHLPAPLSAKECLPMVVAWLDGAFAKTVVPDHRCRKIDFDGSLKVGWEVHLDSNYLVICAIRPAFLWYGK
jgi:hypothetical protein